MRLKEGVIHSSILMEFKSEHNPPLFIDDSKLYFKI